MDALETYEFDRLGYLVLKDMLTPEDVAELAEATDELEAHALQHRTLPPRKISLWGQNYHANPERGYHVWGEKAPGETLMIEDFFNANPVFDRLVNHPRTMNYIRAIVQGPIRINNSEIRIRYPGNATSAHMGGPIDHKYRYNVNQRGIDCMMVRMVYFLHDVTNEQGAFCVLPGTHKSAFSAPFWNTRLAPEDEPGMIGLEVKAGDAILFTENLRHGGFTNRSQQTRRTLHIGYGPVWMMSQNIATMDEPQFFTPETLARYDAAQRALAALGKQEGK